MSHALAGRSMTTRVMARIARDRWQSADMRQTYWDARKLASEVARLFRRNNRTFLRHAVRDEWRYLTGTVHPVPGETTDRARAAVAWLLHAQARTPDAGVPVGYFPCQDTNGGWMPSYPETTGYIITTLLAYAARVGATSVADAALKMADWEISIQMPTGAVQGGPVCPAEDRTPAAFNTGMVLDGWCSAFEATGAQRYLEAGRRAASFLAADLDEEGYFRTNGAYVSSGEIKTYTCLCAWAMYRYGQLAGVADFCDAALKVIDAALRQQEPNGWFRYNCLTRSDAPLTHTIGYTLQGVLELGLLAGRERYVTAAMKCADALLARIDRHGLLPARFYPDWQPASLSSCLTGNAQIAIVCFLLYEHTGAPKYRHAAEALVDTLKSLQIVDTAEPALNGAIPGSFPLFGEYMRAGYPNWATKYFIDALMLQREAQQSPVAAEMPPSRGSRMTAT
jgi:hypothetical protein